jgi:hypothetical protein
MNSTLQASNTYVTMGCIMWPRYHTNKGSVMQGSRLTVNLWMPEAPSLSCEYRNIKLCKLLVFVPAILTSFISTAKQLQI